MVLHPDAAEAFIADYTEVLTEAHRLADCEPSPNTLRVLALGRDSIRRIPDLLSRALASLEERGEHVAGEMLDALHSLRLRQWVYLKDMGKRSIFLDAAENEAFGVVGLTGPVRGILGGAGVTFRAGVLEYCGRYVCDGILENHAWLGPTYKREFTAQFQAIKREERFRCL